MKLRSRLISWLGALLFLAGVMIGLSLSAGVLWGEIEARIYSSYSGDQGMRLECPLMISPAESGTASAVITNPTDEETKPVVNAEISHAHVARRESQMFFLAPGDTGEAQWVVDSSDAIFGNLIIVNILQSRYSTSPSRLGSCGILLFSLFGLTGMQTLGLIFAGSILGILFGGGLWLYTRRALNGFSASIAQPAALLAGITVAALLSSLPRWWGLTLVLDAISVLIIGIILVEFILFPKRDN